MPGKTKIDGYDPDELRRRWVEAEERKRERERMYGVRYNEAMEIDSDFISSKEYASLFDGITGDKSVDDKLLSAARRALIHNSGTSYESMTFIDVATGESVSVDSDIPGGVAYNDEVRAFIDARREGEPRVVTLHNHPNGTPPSADDLSKMSENNYLLGIVAGHNGQVYTYDYHGPSLDEKLRDTIAEDVARLCQYGYDVDRAFNEVFEEYGLSYEVR